MAPTAVGGEEASGGPADYEEYECDEVADVHGLGSLARDSMEEDSEEEDEDSDASRDEDSGEDDEEIPATATRRSTRAR